MDEEMVNVNSFPCTEQRLIEERIQRKSASGQLVFGQLQPI
jgi:hypothetical protein